MQNGPLLPGAARSALGRGVERRGGRDTISTMTRRRPPARHLLAVLALALAAGSALAPAALAQGTVEVALRRFLDLERRLLAEDLAALREARAAEAEAAALLDELIAGLDEAIAAGAAPATVAAFEGPVAEADAALSAAVDRVDRVLATLSERLRRLRLLSAGAGFAAEAAVADVLTGNWAVEVQPGAISGQFQIEQYGTLLSGSYRFDDGSRGSLEGTFAGGQVRLRRIDVVSGFDAVFEGAVGAAAERMEGRWQATVLGRGGAGGGAWTAVRVPPGAELVPEDEVEAGPGDLPVAGPGEAGVAGPDPTTPAGTEDSPPAGPLDEPVVEEEPIDVEPADEPPLATREELP